MSFWNDISKPIVGLSPMDGITDFPFRAIQKKYGNPDVVYTEFTSVEGVCHGATRLLQDFEFDDAQRPVVAQIYGTTPSFFRQTAVLLCELGFDGIDINMGCPAKNVAHSGAGAALIETPKLAVEIIQQTKAGVGDFLNGQRTKDCPDITEEIAREVARRHALLPANYQPVTEMPVSVKTRVGFRQKVVDEWIPILAAEQPAVIAVHGRTLKQAYGGQADWEEIAKGAEYTKNTSILYFGNGDIKTRSQALEVIDTYAVDGVLIGRGSFGNPFIFRSDYVETDELRQTLLAIALEHAHLYEDSFAKYEKYSFLPMRKHLGWYVKGFQNASEIRQAVFRTNTAAEVEALFQEYDLL